METLIAYLETLKNSVPVNFTLFNLQRLKINWAEFKSFVSALPEELAIIKDAFLQRLEELKIKIDAIEGFFKSTSKARFAFQEATVTMKLEMDAAIWQLQGIGNH